MKHASLRRAMSTTKLTEGNPSTSDFFFKSDGILIFFHNALLSVLPFPVEELTETVVKTWEELLLDGVENETVFFDFFHFLLV